MTFRVTLLGLIFLSSAAASEVSTRFLAVAAVQMRSSRVLSENVERIEKHIREAAEKGARVAIFPECALTGYFEDTIQEVSAEALSRAENKIAAACKAARIYAIVGTPTRDTNKLFNSAAVFSPAGVVIERYHKIQLAEQWPASGSQLSVFRIDGVPCSVIICHDERYPELVRLPVVAGAKVIFYVSHESGLREEHKVGPYRAQIQARAVENTVFVVHANAPANKDTTGSHGQSRIIAPDGNIIEEASIFGEQTLHARLDLSKATRANARNSLERGPLRDWWREGLKHVRVID
jgi:predicted amidohydrolase